MKVGYFCQPCESFFGKLFWVCPYAKFCTDILENTLTVYCVLFAIFNRHHCIRPGPLISAVEHFSKITTFKYLFENSLEKQSDI